MNDYIDLDLIFKVNMIVVTVDFSVGVPFSLHSSL